MENKQIKELMAAMERCGTTKIQIKKGSFEITLERNSEVSREYHLRSSGTMADTDDFPSRFSSGQHKSNAPLPKAGDMAAAIHQLDEKKEVSGQYITSPMVGTFYSAPSPDEPDFVKPGDFIEKGQIVCIIEAMKVMNEIKAHISGVIVEVLVESGHPVEFGAKIFRVQ